MLVLREDDTVGYPGEYRDQKLWASDTPTIVFHEITYPFEGEERK